MKTTIMAVVALIPLLALTACDAPKPSDNSGGNSAVQNEKEPAPAPPPGPVHGYAEHLIFNDRHSSVKEITYVSPVDGKTMVCTVYSSGTGAGNSCRVKG